MESEVKGFAHTFLMVLLVLAVYTMFVKAMLPSTVQDWIGV